jgi:stress response protein YsnF
MSAGDPDARDADAVEVIRSEQRLVAGVERRVGGRVRIAKRVVTEERTVTVTVRREELVVEHLPVPGTDARTDTEPGTSRTPDVPPAPHGSDAVVTLVLSEEVPEVSVRVVPRERVRAYVDRVTTLEVVTEDVDLERVDVHLEDLAGR